MTPRGQGHDHPHHAAPAAASRRISGRPVAQVGEFGSASSVNVRLGSVKVKCNSLILLENFSARYDDWIGAFGHPVRLGALGIAGRGNSLRILGLRARCRHVRWSHNPLVVGSSPTRPTIHAGLLLSILPFDTALQLAGQLVFSIAWQQVRLDQISERIEERFQPASAVNLGRLCRGGNLVASDHERSFDHATISLAMPLLSKAMPCSCISSRTLRK